MEAIVGLRPSDPAESSETLRPGVSSAPRSDVDTLDCPHRLCRAIWLLAHRVVLLVDRLARGRFDVLRELLDYLTSSLRIQRVKSDGKTPNDTK